LRLFFREKIRRLPSVCVRKDGRMVGFYGIEALGWLNHQFVFQEHRNKGLGTLMEIAHAAGMKVCKLVELRNLSTLDSSKRSKYWTLAKENDKEVVINYLDLFK
uniref:Glycine N-acyltransferase-like protein n=1 Tax=Heligmosomoides polygyrus TaxID=6339 RepID=A0A183FIS4_HELPZ